MSGKRKYPRAQAIAVARELCQALAPGCARLIVAGSLRRRKAEVGDVDILYIPRFEERQLDLVTHGPVNLADEVLDSLLAAGVLSKRPSSAAGFAWGPKNKLAIHGANGIPVDLFAATEGNWWNLLVCRTGPEAMTISICEAARRHGWQWNPHGPGFSRLDGAGSQAVRSEEEVFAFVGLPYAPPEGRG
jgi:DNA polymerase/3'-5' exonuclease PolX